MLKVNNHIWYLASPYANVQSIQDNTLPYSRYIKVSKLAGLLLEQGIAVYCPILVGESVRQWVPALRETMGHDDWMRLDQVFMEAAHGMLVYTIDGWRESAGVNAEIAYFKATEKPIHYVSESTHPMQVYSMLYPKEEYFDAS